MSVIALAVINRTEALAQSEMSTQSQLQLRRAEGARWRNLAIVCGYVPGFFC